MLKIQKFDKEEALREVIGTQAVCCPICGYDYIHPIEVCINSGGDVTRTNSRGSTKAQGKANGRGASIYITYLCEYDCMDDGEISPHAHKFIEVIQFHKGQTFKKTFHFGKPTEEDVVIWRD